MQGAAATNCAPAGFHHEDGGDGTVHLVADPPADASAGAPAAQSRQERLRAEAGGSGQTETSPDHADGEHGGGEAPSNPGLAAAMHDNPGLAAVMHMGRTPPGNLNPKS